MRLYTLTGATQVDDPVHGSFEAGAEGAFEFPNELSARLHAFHVGGEKAWETDAERADRLQAEQLERMRDPATLLAAVQALASHQADLATAMKSQQPAPAEVLAPEVAATAEKAAEPGEPAAKPAARRTSRRNSAK